MNPFFDQLAEKKLLVIGDVFLDEYILGRSSRISPEAPVPIVNVNQTYSVLGGAGNTAANITSLGARCVLIGSIGKDSIGGEFKSLCKKSNISFYGVAHSGPSIKKTRLISQNQQLLRIDYEKPEKLSTSQNKKVFELFKKKVDWPDAVLLSDYDKGFFSSEVCQKIIQHCKRLGKPVIVDPRPQNASYYPGCDFITPNWKEAQGLLGLNYKPLDKKRIQDVASKLKKRFKSNVIITLGEWGLYYLSKNSKESYFLPTHAKEVFDVSGAGDTFVAVFGLGCASNIPVKTALSLANQAAGAVVAKRGTARVVLEDFDVSAESERIVDRKSLKPLSQKLKRLGKKIVTINGSFDLLHAGHLHILESAKKQGDVLLLGLNSDLSIKKYKGKKRPLINETDRAKMLLALKVVDYVHIFSEQDPRSFLKEVSPDIHVNGSEYGKKCIEADVVKKGGGSIFIVKKVPGLSTTNLIHKIKGLPL